MATSGVLRPFNGRVYAEKAIPAKQLKLDPEQSLLSRYAAKKAELAALEKQRETLRFEIMELEAELNIQPDVPFAARAVSDVNMLRKKVSTMFQSPQKLQEPLKKRTSMLFNNLVDVKGRIEEQHNEFTRKGSDLARNFFSSILPKKGPCAADSSILFDDIAESSVIHLSFLLSDDEQEQEISGDVLGVDIDDYSSDEDDGGKR